MADALSTYYSPRETGFATILPQGTNVAALAGQAANMQQRAMAARDKRKQRVVESTRKLIDKPWTTDQLWQPELDKKVNAGRAELEQLLVDGNETEAFNKARSLAQEWASFASNAKQAAKVINELPEADFGKYDILNKGALKDAIAESLLDKDGNLVDPGRLNLNKYSIDEFIFNRPDGHKLLNQDEVLKRMLDSDNLKATVTEHSTLGDRRNLGGNLQSIQEKTETIEHRPFAEIDPATGLVKVMDPKGLVDNGMTNMFLDDRFMAKLIEGNVDDYIRDNNEIPRESMGQRANDMLRGVALRSMLGGTDMGRVIKTDTREIVRSIPRRGGTLNNAQKEFLGQQDYYSAMTSGNKELVEEAMAYTDDKVRADMIELGEVGPSEKVSGYTVMDDGKVELKITEFKRKDGQNVVVTKKDEAAIKKLDNEKAELEAKLKEIEPRTKDKWFRFETIQGKSSRQKQAIAEKEKIDARLAEIKKEKNKRVPATRTVIIDPADLEDETILNMHSESAAGRGRGRPFGSDEVGKKKTKDEGIEINWK